MVSLLKWAIDHGKDIGEWIAILTALYAFFLFAKSKVYKPLRKHILRVTNLLAKVEEYLPLLMELKPNGGGSVKDLIQRTNQEVISIKNKQEAVIALNPDCLFQCDKNGHCNEVNESLCKLFGASKEEMLGYGWLDFIVPIQRESVKSNWENALKSNLSVSGEYDVINGFTEEVSRLEYVAHIKRSANNEILNIFGRVNIKN